MFTKRPSLPVGHSLSGLPPVARALHSDDRCELYDLVSSGEEVKALLLVRHSNGIPAGRLADWWSVQNPKVLSVVKLLSPGEASPNSMGAVFSLRGKSFDEWKATDVTDTGLKQLFHAMLDVVEQGAPVGMYPDFSSSLAWFAADIGMMCTLLPLDGPAPPEADQVRMVAKAFYRIATGIEPERLAGNVPALLRWSKFGGEELSRIIDRCLAPASPKTSITSLRSLNHALGRVRLEATNLAEHSHDRAATQSSSKAGQGLDKVAGMHALKELLRRDVVAPVRNPEPYKRYGLSIPNGILLYGPPGCGKTYIARQLAEELGHYFVEIIPSELASPYIHQSVIKIRELFDAAAEQAPAVMFIDEFEALVPSRAELGGHQQYKSEEVNEFLAHLNSCSEKNIFVIAATNRPEKIDAAVRRTGRLDKLIYVGPPDEEARREMLALHLEGRPLAKDFDLETIARGLEFYSASDLRYLVDEAARDALMKRQDITNESFRTAMARGRPSITREIEVQYQSIEQRGL
jgi:AAA+ superfamily predicted ATPase